MYNLRCITEHIVTLGKNNYREGDRHRGKTKEI